MPVGLMFFEGAPRLAESGVSIPHLQAGDASRIVVEAYPGCLARQIINRRSYKQDSRNKQTTAQRKARDDLLNGLRKGALDNLYGIEVEAPDILCEDPSGDQIDALLCAIQAAWAWHNRAKRYGAATSVDSQKAGSQIRASWWKQYLFPLASKGDEKNSEVSFVTLKGERLGNAKAQRGDP